MRKKCTPFLSRARVWDPTSIGYTFKTEYAMYKDAGMIFPDGTIAVATRTQLAVADKRLVISFFQKRAP